MESFVQTKIDLTRNSIPSVMSVLRIVNHGNFTPRKIDLIRQNIEE
jgi:hypothetical protein